MDLVLASTSPWRLEMLQSAGLSVRALEPGVDEGSDEPDPARRARLLAERKVRAVLERAPGAWVIGADQVVHAGGGIRGKPRDPEDHVAGLLEMRGRSHDLITGWCLIGPGFVEGGHARTRLHVRGDLTEAELRAYVATGEGSGCAGGYAIEGHGAFLFERIEGDWFNILGLPLLDLLGVLRSRGWRYGGRR